MVVFVYDYLCDFEKFVCVIGGVDGFGYCCEICIFGIKCDVKKWVDVWIVIVF